MTLRHGGCPEMTRSIGSVDRIRWLGALVASATLAMLTAFGLHQWQVTPVQGASSSGLPAPAGSSPLDPRIARLASTQPKRSIEAIVQFKADVSPERPRWDVSRSSGHVIGDLHIINALAARMTAA